MGPGAVVLRQQRAGNLLAQARGSIDPAEASRVATAWAARLGGLLSEGPQQEDLLPSGECQALSPPPPSTALPPPYRPTDDNRQPRSIDPLSRVAARSRARLLHRSITPRATPQRWGGETDILHVRGGGQTQRFEGSC